jgi:outer membrane protein OmpA-like peptidoglycan-associated protein
LKVVSYGEERPLDASSNERAWALNRRAEFVITWGGDAPVKGTVE